MNQEHVFEDLSWKGGPVNIYVIFFLLVPS